MSNLLRMVEGMQKLGLIKIIDKKKLENHCSEFCVCDWHIDDVKQTAEEDDKTITEDDCRQVLSAMESNHDASVGINWDVIRYQMENLGL